jgi:hypothetical protein
MYNFLDNNVFLCITLIRNNIIILLELY